MFVRWQQDRSQAVNPWHRDHNDDRARLKTILVESVRVNGKPRQKHIAFLGSTTIDSIGNPSPRFWYDVTTRLNRLVSVREVRESFESVTVAELIGWNHV